MSWLDPRKWFTPTAPKVEDEIKGLPDDYNPTKEFEKIIKPIIEGILSPIQSIIDDITGFFREIWLFFLAIFGFAYMGLLLTFAVYATVFIILL